METSGTARAIRRPRELIGLVDWGAVPDPVEGESYTSGVLLHKGPEGRSECGVWVCTPGRWPCHVTRDEFCYFLAGRAIYTHASGEVLEVTPETAAFFPEGWKGECVVTETVRKVYMIR